MTWPLVTWRLMQFDAVCRKCRASHFQLRSTTSNHWRFATWQYIGALCNFVWRLCWRFIYIRMHVCMCQTQLVYPGGLCSRLHLAVPPFLSSAAGMIVAWRWHVAIDVCTLFLCIWLAYWCDWRLYSWYLLASLPRIYFWICSSSMCLTKAPLSCSLPLNQLWAVTKCHISSWWAAHNCVHTSLWIDYSLCVWYYFCLW